jgi:tetratricopeptide (TPR) repeat protein
MKKLIILSVLSLWCLIVSASVNTDIIGQANTAYTQNKFNQAIDLYKQVIANGFESPELYYNLGNSYFKLKNYPSAVLYYEKARKLDPSNEKINFNIKVVNARIIDKIEELPKPFFKRWAAAFCEMFSLNVWALFSIVFLFLFFIFIAVYLLANLVSIRKLTFWAAWLFLVIALLSGANAYSQYRNIKTSDEAIIFEPTVNVKSSPDANSQDLFVIHEGTKVSITDKVGNWIEVRIANGSDGWIAETAGQRI